MNGLTLLGVDARDHQLYWDGERLVTEKRFSRFERTLVGLIFGGIGAISAAALTLIEVARVLGWASS